MTEIRGVYCVCGHPQIAHLYEQRIDTDGKVIYLCQCCYCDCKEFIEAKPMAEQTAQQRVVGSVCQRGYLDGWTYAQLAARQICKLQEELAELSACVTPSPFLEGEAFAFNLQKAGAFARRLFDIRAEWGYEPTADIDALKKEAADMQVVLFCLAASIEGLTNQPFDIVAAAVEKSTSDEKRGVR